MRSDDSVEKLEQVLEAHCEYLRLVENKLKRRHGQDYELQRVPYDDGFKNGMVLQDNALEYGAKHGSARIAELSLKTFSGLRLDSVLRMAILRGSLSVVQVVHPKERERFGIRSDTSTIDFAACIGRLDIIKWVHTTYGLPNTHCSGWVSGHTAANGYLEVLKWVYTSYVDWDSSAALAQDAEHNNYDIMG